MNRWNRIRSPLRGLLILVSIVILVSVLGIQLVWLVLQITDDVASAFSLTTIGVAYLWASVHGGLTRWSR